MGGSLARRARLHFRLVSSLALSCSWACAARTIQILEAGRRRRAVGPLAGGALAAHHPLCPGAESATVSRPTSARGACPGVRRLVGASCLTCFSHVRCACRLNSVLRPLVASLATRAAHARALTGCVAAGRNEAGIRSQHRSRRCARLARVCCERRLAGELCTAPVCARSSPDRMFVWSLEEH